MQDADTSPALLQPARLRVSQHSCPQPTGTLDGNGPPSCPRQIRTGDNILHVGGGGGNIVSFHNYHPFFACAAQVP